VIAQLLASLVPDKPMMLFTGNARDRRTWWHPNQLCMEQMLRSVGFNDVRMFAQEPFYGRGGAWQVTNQVVIHATK
jgi:hypothetical protein